ncbi:unnamed protein product [Macrosiphum euphorbiae]|uniref:Uncharacterized protein n=1 Tax=Macrosiphum euphorbiae TaxID=13131 RepID=A0AAV0WL79_9HEMI|nr:unnamed protein product [Macrosiphum euphorbiae]CAI6356749.1 unnamed protein product [Macrosiphum euphorbiae]
MNAEDINAALSEDSFNFSEFDEDIIDPYFILGECSAENNDLHGIHPLISSDSEHDENLQECMVVGSAYVQDGFENEDEVSVENDEQGS